MHYCRFQNTLSDLQELWNEFDPSNEEERKAAKKLVVLCKKIAESYDPDDFD
jgi:hypothetical protein